MPLFETVSVVTRLLAGCWLLWRVNRPRAADPGAEASRRRRPLAVVVPARNEAANLPALLASLAPQLGPGDEVVVVDDHSTDGTAVTAAAAGARVVCAPDLPVTWTGKASACWAGAAATAAATLVFLDADVTVAPGGLDRLVAEHRRRGGLVSVQPYHVTRRPYEWLSAMFNVVGLMGSDACTPLGHRLSPAGAFGPVLVTARADYQATGGHAHPSVASAVLDDVALARRYRDEGVAVTVLGGRGTASFRMYPAGLASLVEGWSKNMAGGAGATRPLTLVLVVAWLSLCIQAAWWMAAVLATGEGPGTGPAFTLTVYAAVAVQLAWMFTRVGRFGPLPALAFPVPLAFFLAVFARSVFLTAVRRRVRWKGRDVAV